MCNCFKEVHRYRLTEQTFIHDDQMTRPVDDVD